jgi:hypothetical protein
MSQAEVIDFLKSNHSRFFTEREISKALNKSRCKVALKSLRKFPPEGFNFKRIRKHSNHLAFVYQIEGC